MSNESVIAVPADVTNPMELRRFLTKLVEAIDVSLGYRGDAVTVAELTKRVVALESK